MKDLDFDELDRAVNSLIGSPSAPTNPPVATASADTPTPVDNSVPVTTPSTEDTQTTPASLQPLAARRSSGRFMDVVHPSSDMRSSSVPARPAVREGMTVQPITTEPVATVAPETSPAPIDTAPKTSEWPDPLDFHGFKDEPVAPKPTDKPDGQDKLTEELSLPDFESTTPLESPFLPDAKVEKRPLGAFADSSVPAAETPAKETPEVQADENTDHPIGAETPLPAELQDSLLSIESNEDTALTSQDVEPLKPQSAVVETMSIPQQYVEQPSTGDKPAASSIFDVEAYRKPAQTKNKKSKSGWLMVLWILLLIILGVGAGAGFYFYLLPLL